MEDYTTAHRQDFFRRLAARRWQVEIQRRFDDLAEVVPAIAAVGATVVIDHFGLPQGGIDPANRRTERPPFGSSSPPLTVPG
ncbi:hypothetical protein [Azospirillum endophyticum]|uniref:hypothetical protein n=1 Tax=Azospirillum endophyticum TaxID=2800326 RepID=UPI001FFF1BEA|nr:hypothetical protein [Azospirillum endophyticum]